MIAPDTDVPLMDVVEVVIGVVVITGAAVCATELTQMYTPFDSHFPDSVCVTLYPPESVFVPPLQLPVLPLVFQQKVPVPSTVALDTGLGVSCTPF
jgi:hypothetical protein